MTDYATNRETIIAGIVILFDSPFFFAVVDLHVLFALICFITAKAIRVLGYIPNLEQSIIGDYPWSRVDNLSSLGCWGVGNWKSSPFRRREYQLPSI